MENDLRRWMRLVESDDLDPEAEAPAEDERPYELSELLMEWIDTDPNMTDDYKQQKITLAQSMLLYEDIAAKFRHVPASVLYRGLSLRKPRFNMDGYLIVKPRRTDVFESWTTDPPMANLHAVRPWLVDSSLRKRTMTTSAHPFVITEQVTRLPIWINVKALMDSVGRYTNENEIIVRAGLRIYGNVAEADIDGPSPHR